MKNTVNIQFILLQFVKYNLKEDKSKIVEGHWNNFKHSQVQVTTVSS